MNKVIQIAFWLIVNSVSFGSHITFAQESQIPFGPADSCVTLPPFIFDLGMQQPVAIDTQQLSRPGVSLLEVTGQRRSYQHSSWRQIGYVGSTVRDRFGAIYVIPVPTIGLDSNPLEARNRIYRIDGNTGVMQLFMELPLPAENSQFNPFGTLGMTYDCSTHSLYVSSVAGSTSQAQNGVIYKIDLLRKLIADQYQGRDVIGLGIFNFAEQRRLYFGEARSSNVYSIPLRENGDFDSLLKPRYEFSLLDIKNGDSTQAAQIKFSHDQRGASLVVTETEFSYRLTAQTGRQFRKYRFILQNENRKWLFSQIE